MRSLAFVLRRCKGQFALVLVLGLIFNTGMSLLTPLFLKQLFDACIASRDLRRFAVLLTVFLAIATACRLIQLYQNLRLQKLKQSLLATLSAELLRKFYRLPQAAAQGRGAGYSASRIYDEPLAVSKASVELSLELASGVTTLAASAALLAALSARTAGLLAVCVLPLIWLAQLFGAQVKRHAAGETEEEARLRGFVAAAAQAYRTVRIFGLLDAVCAALGERMTVYTDRSYRRFESACTHNAASGILMSLAETAVIVVCGLEMIGGRLTFGGFMAFMSAFWSAAGALRVMIQKFPEVAKTEAMIARLRDFLAQPEAPAGEGSAAKLEDVGFRYGAADVLAGVTLEVAKGEKVLLAGRNGSGKSTLAALICGLLSPSRGKAAVPDLSRVSACLAPHEFIPGTVRDNLACERLSPAGSAYLSTLLEDFGVEDILDRDPEQLSSGQRKKVELMMGLLKEADLYVFDEPLANLDSQSKAPVMRHILQRAQGKGLLVIIHGDQEFAPRFDRVVDVSEEVSDRARVQKRRLVADPAAGDRSQAGRSKVATA